MARNESCETCDGSGAKPNSTQSKCPECNGKGHTIEKSDRGSLIQVECEGCQGLGHSFPSCLSCSGLGSVRSKVIEKVDIPAGVYTGLILRSKGKGNQMKKGMGQPGDLLLKVTVEDHKVFKRDAENIVSEAEIPFTKAVFGGTVNVETLKGPTQITI